MRKSEKDRNSSCTFANEIASVVIDEYKKIPLHIRQRYKQTVLAAIVAVDSTSTSTNTNTDNIKYQVISMGIGTKTLPISVYLNERKSYSNNNNDNNNDDSNHNREACTLIRDCHAEVLARRG